MTYAVAIGPLVAYAAAFQTLVFLAIPARLRLRWAPWTIGLVGAGLTLAAATFFGFGSIGLGPASPGVVLSWGGGALVFAFLAGRVMLSDDRLRPRLADPRVSSLTTRQAFTQICFRIPVMTAFIEEAFFRGVLHAALFAVYPPELAFVMGAVLFGLWHVGPAIDQAEAGDFPRFHVLGTVALTSLLGLGLVWLRIETGSIWAPVAVHAILNMTMAIFARLAGREIATRTGDATVLVQPDPVAS